MADQPFIPRFSDPRDVDEFVEKLEAFERGELSPEAFRAFRLTRGVYGQRQPEAQMIRVKFPYGIFGRPQLEALADVAETHSRGFAHVTTRQNVQLHFVKMSEAEAAMRRFDEAGVTIREACGNSVRTVTACERAAVCGDSAFDVSPYAEGLTRYFLRHPLAATLPRKFKIAFSGCETDCAFAAIHDLGFIARARAEDGAPGFKVVVAGGLSTMPMSAMVLEEFVVAPEIARVGEAILRIFDRLGNRENRHRARLKYVRKKLGDEGLRAEYAKVRAEVDAEAKAELKLPDDPPRTPAPAVPWEGSLPEGYLQWRASAVIEQRQDGYAGVYVRLLLGDLDVRQFRGLGPILETYGDGSARFTIDQNVFIPFVDKRSLPALFVALSAIGLGRAGAKTVKDVTSCPGAETCNLAVTSSRRLAGAISARLEEADVQALLEGDAGTTSIKISGCPNSCGQHHVAAIGFHGAARKEGGTTYPMYQLHLGGGVDATGATFGRQVIKVLAQRAPEAVVKLLGLYRDARTEGETPNAFFARVDPKRVSEALGTLLDPARPEEANDIGEQQGFVVAVGAGECAA
jgi:sulfite reductase (NADPH) hemoprotein beta-component